MLLAIFIDKKLWSIVSYPIVKYLLFIKYLDRFVNASQDRYISCCRDVPWYVPTTIS